uniref:Uncharacterized 36 kDa protein n=1 Tax=Halobacterium sp. (strain GN101) TaxID=88773 RepID=Y36K_HALSN|nr:RecName: Full=Uncharacterized 36 kDa protein [Halobacterium sp. GN101]pir/S06780/ hypothetical protein - Halobacterium sp. plasmid pHGN1 [Halobacterium sp.]CAA34480.1 putative 36kDa protein [Halobacterium sp. GN101]
MASQPEEGFGERLRKEVTVDTSRGVRATSTAQAVENFEGWYADQRDTQMVVEEATTGERVGFRTPNRFTPEYREMLYAKAQSLERGLREEWGDLLHTAMVTLTASTTEEDGGPRPLVDHLRDLLSSWSAVYDALRHTLEDREFEYLAIIEPTTPAGNGPAGYAHIHLGVFVKGPVVAEQFQDVLDAHVKNSEGAGREAHRAVVEDDEDEAAVSIRRSARPDREDGIENLGAYLAAYMAGEYGVEALAMPAHVRAFYAAMWATGTQWFRPSNGAQRHMQPESDDEESVEEWEMVGIAPEGDLEDEIIEVDPEQPRDDPYRRLRTPPPGG